MILVRKSSHQESHNYVGLSQCVLLALDINIKINQEVTR